MDAIIIYLSLNTDKAIELASGDVERITAINERERGENRMEQCQNKKEEIDVLVESEIEMVDTWLVTCKSDKCLLSMCTCVKLRPYTSFSILFLFINSSKELCINSMIVPIRTRSLTTTLYSSVSRGIEQD